MELLTNYPIKKDWIQWALVESKKFYSTCRKPEEFLEKAKIEVNQIGGKCCIWEKNI
jgi:preprotein translocase subunit Sss1